MQRQQQQQQKKKKAEPIRLSSTAAVLELDGRPLVALALRLLAKSYKNTG
jgi:hypothetical protein